MIMLPLCCLLAVIMVVESAVLDPALFLLPSPPFTTTYGLFTSAEQRKADTTRVAREAETTVRTAKDQDHLTSTEESDSMESAETFWPGLRAPAYGIRGIHIPVTFSVSGTYGSGSGGYGSHGTGILGSSYASISGDGDGTYGGFGKSALAGSSYGTYPGVRVFGSGGKTGWSGWGNGKWGHYGKG